MGFQREYSPTIALQIVPEEVADFLINFDMKNPPSSARISRDFLTLCTDETTMRQKYLPEDDITHKVSSSCSKLAQVVLQDSPSFARAHVLSLVTSDIDDITTEQYHAARMAAPYEPWPLGQRLLIAEALVLRSDAHDFNTEIQADIQAAMHSSWGRQFLAAIWARQPNMRDIITAIAEQIPDADQRHFLTFTKRALHNG